ncbi:MAG: four helix bundle protein [Bacteroidetes bacterium]|nr:MAG: four helix bundle protein [Bacteroidota bacterium]
MKMSKIERFEDLVVWKLARKLCKEINLIIQETPLKNDYKLRDQIKGSSGSVMDNIAEGFERDGNKEFIQFLSISKGSCGETRSQVYRCYDFGYIDNSKFEKLISDCIILNTKINNLISYLKKSSVIGRKYKP